MTTVMSNTPTRPPEVGHTTGSVLGQVPGLSLRQIDYWERIGAIAPSVAAADGSGTYRAWSDRDVQRLRAIIEMRESLSGLVHQSGFSADGIRAVWDGLADADEVTIGPITVSL